MDKSKPIPHNEMSYEAFKLMAQDESLSKYEKIGFPDDYRKNKEKIIFEDISSKLKLDRTNLKVLDIGCGCSDLADFVIENSEKNQHELLMLDSKPMLDLLPEGDYKKIDGKFPDCMDDLKNYHGELDAIIAYSVMQHVVLDSNPFSFIDKALDLLKPTGMLLLGDIPNNTKRNRFFSSARGLKSHHDFVGSTEVPPPLVNYPETFEKIDDGILFGILTRYRSLGFETYILPQNDELPMANRREDLLIFKN